MLKRVAASLVMALWMVLGGVAASAETLQQATRNLDRISAMLQEQEHNVVHLEAQLDNIARQQRATGDSTNRCKWQLAELRGQYAQVVRNLHARSSAIDWLAYIFSASSISQAWQRATHIRQLSQWRENRSNTITDAMRHLDRQQQYLKKLSATRQASLDNCNATRIALQNDLDNTARLIATMSSPQLHAVLDEKRAQADKLGAQLDRITTLPREVNTTQTLVETATLELNTGSLPHPASGRYTVVTPFGRQHHPTLEHVWTVNNGIDIACSDPGAMAHAVGDGAVSAIYSQGDGRYVVMVRHGGIISVYGGLTAITVKKGQAVASGQQLGNIASDPVTRQRTMHFELRRGHEPLNPELYLQR